MKRNLAVDTYRLLAIDGCDGTGKSTLAASLGAQHGYRAIHSPRTPEHIDLVARYQCIFEKPGRVVLDRCFVSELVYGPLRHGGSRLSWADAVALSRRLAERSGALLHLTGSPATIRDRLIKRGDTDPPSQSEIARLVAAYQQIFDALRPHAPVISMDISVMPPPGG